MVAGSCNAFSLARSGALSCLVGGFSACAYLRTVSRAIPSSLAMARRDSPLQPGLLDRLPPGQLGGRGRTPPRVRCLAGGVLLSGVFPADSLDRGLVDAHRFQGGQTTLLGPADVVITHAADDAFEFGSGRPSGDRRPQRAHPRRWLLRGHSATLVLDDEFPVGPFQHVDP